eukprot:2673346-Amphidinium_carterae.1
MPKKVAAQCFGPATREMMRYIKEKTNAGDAYAAMLVQDCVEELEASEDPSTASGYSFDMEKDMLDDPELVAKAAKRLCPTADPDAGDTSMKEAPCVGVAGGEDE